MKLSWIIWKNQFVSVKSAAINQMFLSLLILTSMVCFWFFPFLSLFFFPFSFQKIAYTGLLLIVIKITRVIAATQSLLHLKVLLHLRYLKLHREVFKTLWPYYCGFKCCDGDARFQISSFPNLFFSNANQKQPNIFKTNNDILIK